MGPYVVRNVEHAMQSGITSLQLFIFVLVVVTRSMKYLD